MAIKLSNEGKLLLGILGVTLLLITMSALLADDANSENLNLSTYSSRTGGAKATFLLIQELGYSVERWTSSPSSLPADSQNTLLVIATPTRIPTDDDRAAINKFIDRGGSVLLAGNYATVLMPYLRVRFDIPSKSWQSYPAQVPHPLNQGVAAITMPRGPYWETESEYLPLYGQGEHAVAVVVNRGQGRILWLASPVPLSNAGLKADGNPEFLANILAVTGSRRVLWDLYFSQDAPGARSPFNTPALLAGSAQLLFIFALILWTHSRRSGPIRAFDSGPVPMSQMEFVETLGSLYDSAKATNVTVQIAYTRFAFLVSRRFAVSAGNVNQLGEAVALATGEPSRAVIDFLTECDNIQHHGNLSNQEAIERVQRLHAYLVRLKLTPAQPKEKP